MAISGNFLSATTESIDPNTSGWTAKLNCTISKASGGRNGDGALGVKSVASGEMQARTVTAYAVTEGLTYYAFADGIYGELWSAALAASSLVAADVDDLLERAAPVVPPQSELAAAIAFGTEVGRTRSAVDAQLDALHERYGHLHWVHTLNNAATIACAVSASRGDFTAGIGLAVMAGWDTDSAGATVGSALGGLLGHHQLPPQWTKPLDNRIRTSLPGGPVRIDDLVERTLRLARARTV